MALDVKQLWCSESCYTKGGKKKEYILVHYTGAPGSAYNNAVYFSRGGNGQSSAHYFIDDKSCWQSVHDTDTAWAAGNFEMNQRSISIEVCSDGEDFTEGEISQLAELVQGLMRLYSIPAENVGRHYDAVDYAYKDGFDNGRWIDPHKECPAPYVDNEKWHTLWCRITGYDEANGSQPSQPSQPETSGKIEEDGYWGEKTTALLQKTLNCVADGEVWHQYKWSCSSAEQTSGWVYDDTLEGSPVIRALQVRLGVEADGLYGPMSRRALMSRYGCSNHHDAVKQLQHELNQGRI